MDISQNQFVLKSDNRRGMVSSNYENCNFDYKSEVKTLMFIYV